MRWNTNGSYAASGSVWMLTPSTPARAIANSVSSIHSADANVSLTPVWPAQATELSSSIRNGGAVAVRDRDRSRAIPSSRSRAESASSRFGIDG